MENFLYVRGLNKATKINAIRHECFYITVINVYDLQSCCSSIAWNAENGNIFFTIVNINLQQYIDGFHNSNSKKIYGIMIQILNPT